MKMCDYIIRNNDIYIKLKQNKHSNFVMNVSGARNIFFLMHMLPKRDDYVMT